MTLPANAWDGLARLVEYPVDGSYAQAIDACVEASGGLDAASPLSRFRTAMREAGLAAMQERYVEAFDFDPACTLNMGWHVLGDAPERGALLSRLREDLSCAAVDERGELPDHLAALLRLIGREDGTRARALADFMAPALTSMQDRLNARSNPFGDVIDAVARMLTVLQHQEERP